ncbi:reverse transcriptase-like protein [Planococcus sp. ISL-109]|uniref:reverse transcriptase-like protein n=1 Tax=Planococcus sp. ISL-109 TaxID=2819166 RepID=UPI001BEC84A3|nr:reverse transcriptase-like protein [Planococcus sp. ISL-109]MBT2583398.1 reverse transcriptase-like protein [Planococcus sp. ISL-109]
MKVRIDWAYKSPKDKVLQFLSEELEANDAVQIAADLESTGRTKRLQFVDRHNSNWSLKELTNYVAEIETEPHDVIVYYDGGFDRHTKRAGLGCVIYYKQSGKEYRLRKNSAIDELESNNEAEYAALSMAVQELELLGVHHLPVRFIGDSRLLVNQMSGEWAVPEQALARWADRIDERLEKIGVHPEYEFVPRKENAEADRLATQALNYTVIESLVDINAVNE